MVEDGPIGEALAAVIESYRDRLPIVSVRLPENVGLARALNAGLAQCSYELIARMDTDDVCLPARFERQIDFLERNLDVDVLGAMVEEFDSEMSESLGIRRLPQDHASLHQFAKRRSPLSHPTVVFRKQSVLAVGGYPEFRKAQDYALWSLMLTRGYRMRNLNEVLLKMRAGSGMMERRGSAYLKHELSILKFQRRIGFIGLHEYLINYLLRSVVRRSPASIKRLLYKFAR